MTTFVGYNATMATASMTMASHSVDHNPSVTSSTIDHHIESREESIEKLKSNLIRYARSNDRRMILRSLKDVSFLSYIPLDAPVIRSDVSISELEQEVSMEKVILNETLLKPVSATRNFANAGTNRGCVIILKGLAQVLCENITLDKNTVYERVLFRLSKSSTSADIHFQLSSMMGSADLIVKRLPSDYIVKSSSSIINKNKTENNGNPSDLKLYNAGGQIQMTLDSTFNFGLFRKNDAAANRPWIAMHCRVHDRTNLSTNESFRSLNVKTPDLY